jgi:hypothetical protein
MPESNTPICPQSPDTSASDPSKSPDDLQSLLAKLCREGGVDLIHTLLKSAIDEEDPIRPVREWTFCNVLKLPKDKRKVWLEAKAALLIKSLRRSNHAVFLASYKTYLKAIRPLKIDGFATSSQTVAPKPGS